MNNLRYPPNFPKEEWVQDPSRVQQDLLDVMQDLRTEGRTGMIIHEAIGSGHALKGYHPKGLAVDFHFALNKLSYTEQLTLLMGHQKVGGIGFYPEWRPCPGWHLDLRQVPQKLVWVRSNGIYVYGFRALAQAIEKVEGTWDY